MLNEKTEVASAKQQYTITQSDLPLCCPMPNMRLWDSHPRVYMPIQKTGHETCPYCGAEYSLTDVDEVKNSE